jgi:hypothetical protein
MIKVPSPLLDQGLLDTLDDGRLPYETPKLDFEGLFEVLAVACGKVDPSSFNCARIARLS